VRNKGDSFNFMPNIGDRSSSSSSSAIMEDPFDPPERQSSSYFEPARSNEDNFFTPNLEEQLGPHHGDQQSSFGEQPGPHHGDQSSYYISPNARQEPEGPNGGQSSFFSTNRETQRSFISSGNSSSGNDNFLKPHPPPPKRPFLNSTAFTQSSSNSGIPFFPPKNQLPR
jgi:hypothetical protein